MKSTKKAAASTSTDVDIISIKSNISGKMLPSAFPDGEMFDQMNQLSFEDFLSMFVEHVAEHGETNLCYAFYKEFIADGSVVFKNLLVRHSAVLEQWSI
mmetsp:Transcript_17840/g.29923  ORF Transcript_17840/g.29923 Transcript_17840/m.29923 type:complete len:99 (-) Transcript_17840:1196-1492(-)